MARSLKLVEDELELTSGHYRCPKCEKYELRFGAGMILGLSCADDSLNSPITQKSRSHSIPSVISSGSAA